MLASRPLSLVVAVAAAGLTACGGNAGSSGPQKLTRADYDLLVRQHRETAKIVDENGGSQEDAETYLKVIRRHCGDLRAASSALRPTSASCDGFAKATESLVSFSADIGACGESDGACSDKAFRGFVASFDGVLQAIDAGTKAVSGIDASAACRAALRGPDDQRRTIAEVRDTGREVISASAAVEKATGSDAAAAEDRAKAALGRFQAAATALERSDDGLEERDPAPCEADVASS